MGYAITVATRYIGNAYHKIGTHLPFGIRISLSGKTALRTEISHEKLSGGPYIQTELVA